LIVGVHSNATANRYMGSNYPIMSMQERLLGVLGCRHVDDVLLDAPWQITLEMLKTLNVHKVARGTVGDYPWESTLSDGKSDGVDAQEVSEVLDWSDPHKVPKEMGIMAEIVSDIDITTKVIVERLQLRRAEAEERFERKRKKEQEWFNEKHCIAQA